MERVIEDKLHLLQDILATYHEDHLSQLFDEDIAFHLPGRNLISGTHEGKGQVMQMLEVAREHYQRQPYETKVISISTSDNHAAIRTLRQATVGGKPVTWTQTTLFFVRRGRVTEAWVFTDNKEAFDVFWSI